MTGGPVLVGPATNPARSGRPMRCNCPTLQIEGMTSVRKHPLATFFVLSYLLTWSLVPVGGFFPPGPLPAAVLVVALTEGRSGFRRLSGRLTCWRVRWVWYAVAVAVPLGVHALTVAANTGLGSGARTSAS